MARRRRTSGKSREEARRPKAAGQGRPIGLEVGHRILAAVVKRHLVVSPLMFVAVGDGGELDEDNETEPNLHGQRTHAPLRC